MPRRNNRKKNKYEKLRYLTKRDLRAFKELDSMRVNEAGSNKNTAGSSRYLTVHPVYQSAVKNQEDLHELYTRLSPKRGEIWYVDLGEFDRSSVQRGIRPAVIVSSDIANEKSGVVTVVPLTSKMKKTWYPSHIPINDDDLEGSSTVAPSTTTSAPQPQDGKEDGEETRTALGADAGVRVKPRKAIMPSQVLAEQLQTVDKQYLSKRVGKVKHLKMLEIEEGMRESLTL